MKFTPSKSHAFCEKRSCYVPLNQTEGECRDHHRCDDSQCPLEQEFGKPGLAQALEMMAAGIGKSVG